MQRACILLMVQIENYEIRLFFFFFFFLGGGGGGGGEGGHVTKIMTFP